MTVNVIFFATMLFSVVFYFHFILVSNLMPDEKRLVWLFAMFCLGPFALMVVWYNYVWLTRKVEESSGKTGDSDK